MRDTGRLRKPRRTVVALTDENLQAVRTAIRDWQRLIPGRPGPRHNGDLADVVDLMLATGVRIGDIALRWEDLDLATERPTLTICGTLVFVKGKASSDSPGLRCDAGHRVVMPPRFAVGMLLARKLSAADKPHDAIFAFRRGTWLSPNNVRRQWREARADTDAGFQRIVHRVLPAPVGSRDRVTRYRHFNAACSLGKWPRALTARR
ncbi:phage integrase family protein [Micromonospora endolithica]|nr:phage integrase family protein [Micromonospora endolithica]